MDKLEQQIRDEALQAEIDAHENDWHHVETFRHEDGSATLILIDNDGTAESPREYDGNVATLINESSRTIDLDEDDAYLGEARDRFYGKPDLLDRYIAMFRPDIALYVDRWSAGESYGWGYVTTEALEKNFPTSLVGDRDAYFAKHDLTVERLFDAEVKLYDQWASGEIYGYIHLEPGKPVVSYGEEGAYVSDWTVDDTDSCWGFLGYDNLKDIAEQATSSPII